MTDFSLSGSNVSEPVLVDLTLHADPLLQITSTFTGLLANGSSRTFTFSHPRADHDKLEIWYTPADGTCLFHGVSAALATPEDGPLLRIRLADFLKDKDLSTLIPGTVHSLEELCVAEETRPTLEEWCSGLRGTIADGGERDIIALSWMLSTRILVWSVLLDNDDPFPYGDHCGYNTTIRLLHHFCFDGEGASARHYDLLVSRAELNRIKRRAKRNKRVKRAHPHGR